MSPHRQLPSNLLIQRLLLCNRTHSWASMPHHPPVMSTTSRSEDDLLCDQAEAAYLTAMMIELMGRGFAPVATVDIYCWKGDDWLVVACDRILKSGRLHKPCDGLRHVNLKLR